MGIIDPDFRESSQDIFCDINVTPLVDVMLVLLIIFMITAPLMISTLGVELPSGSGGQVLDSNSELIISINQDEKISIADKIFSLPELKDFLLGSPNIKNRQIFIEADKASRHGILVGVMSQAYIAGAQKVNIMMEEPSR